MDESTSANIIAGLIEACFAYAVIGVILAVFVFVAEWCLLNKAGEGGWKLLIPIYGDYTKHKIAGATGIFWGKLAAAVLPYVISAVGAGMGGIDEDGYALLGLVAVICWITLFILGIMYYVRLSHAFGQGGGFAIGLMLLPVIFIPIMAFSSSIQYVGYGAAQPNPVPYNGGTPPTPPTRPLTQGAPNFLPSTAPVEGTLTVAVTSGPMQGARFRVAHSGVLGRDPASQLLLNDPNVARSQCRFEQRNGKFFVVDLGATNATAVTGYGKLPPNTPVELRTGDTLTVGKSTLSIEIQ